MAKIKIYDTAVKPETAILVSVIPQGVAETKAQEYLEELEFLVQTAGGVTKGIFTQKLAYPDRATFVGSGKLEEIQAFVIAEEIDMVVFDDELTPSQLRNIERELKVKILDRSNLILDIFASHAKSAQAKTQVELAQLQYLLPRLTRMWTHLERQRGGIGMRGPGESQIETDRRIILNKISVFKDRLETIDKQNETQRKNRGDMIRVALVGYTNVGKSTIMNMISKSDVLIENKLFATLDTTVRKVVIDNLPFLLSDTVGFIRKLPHHLVECFKSTLDEVREADVLIHVVDISHPNFEDHIQAVNETLKDIGALDKPVITVFNKIDAFVPTVEEGEDGERTVTLEDFENSWMAKNADPAIFISATNKTHLEEFKQKLYEIIVDMHNARYPYNNLLY
ncbi:GTPase HflX [compost metagenome]|jgi:GTP-binding protein HflX|uniref:GTPase HflX n=1 Tax=Sphingobacterium TaxID=28453 RepID=UPI000D3B9188|nr:MULTISPECIES: GTPase HflX [Sphingobacterium]UZJ65802.1 GTPase HflX [Sphingobacterium sp. KU25419]MQP28747.1 GTPase HflX [Sphingobacterium faecium]PTX12705.1 GTP-binding protein HflX [Sphingobacterium faecium]UPZ38094.1 GTPase HflX [Sphingobacterium sp. PCS056]UXD69539.1 GTPase HflX [Sphingobacterium faecium]